MSRWLKGLIISFLIFAVLSLYIAFRQGSYNLFAANRAFASTAVILAGITLIVGPLSKSYKFLTKIITIRRQLGLIAFGYALLHISIVFGGLDLADWIPISFGLVGILVWIYMAYISRNSKIIQMGTDIWKKRLSFAGLLAFAAILLHVVFNQYSKWTVYLPGVKPTTKALHTNLPPVSLFVFLFMFVVVVYRIFVFFKYGRKKLNTQLNPPDSL